MSKGKFRRRFLTVVIAIGVCLAVTGGGVLLYMKETEEQYAEEATQEVVTEEPTPVEVTLPVLVQEEVATEATTAPILSSSLTMTGTMNGGEPFTWAILEGDLSKVDFEEVAPICWDGLEVVCNTDGLIAQVWALSSEGKGRTAKYDVDSSTVQGWFTTTSGELQAEYVRLGWNKDGAGVRTLNLHDLRIVQLEGEEFCRLVITGKLGCGSTGSAASTVAPTATVTPAPMVTEAPTEVPTVVPTEVPTVVPTEVPTVVPTQVPTVVPTQVPTATPRIPTETPTEVPTVVPTQVPTATPRIPDAEVEDELLGFVDGSSAIATPRIDTDTVLDSWAEVEVTDAATPSIGEAAIPSIGAGSAPIDWGFE